MTETPAPDVAATAARRVKRNRRTAVVTLAVVFGMVGASFAAVPFYQWFCQVTGYGGTTQRADRESDRILDRVVKVQFDANIDASLGWTFQPAQRSVTVRLGETALVDYTAVNTSGHETVGTAVFNVTPEAVGRYFSKIQCFCFTEQRLAAGETATLPVLFFVDPALADDPILDYIDTITLSYTFYPARPAPGPVAGTGTAGAG
jgi:cytochrome c oxidase assembly protein subunit 11